MRKLMTEISDYVNTNQLELPAKTQKEKESTKRC
jgi:hypothetical protein